MCWCVEGCPGRCPSWPQLCCDSPATASTLLSPSLDLEQLLISSPLNIELIVHTRSSWLNCALRDDEAVYWVSIGHYEAGAVGNWWYWVSRGHLCLYILNKVGIWTGVTDAWLTHSHLKDRATQLLIKYKSGDLVTQYTGLSNFKLLGCSKYKCYWFCALAAHCRAKHFCFCI